MFDFVKENKEGENDKASSVSKEVDFFENDAIIHSNTKPVDADAINSYNDNRDQMLIGSVKSEEIPFPIKKDILDELDSYKAVGPTSNVDFGGSTVEEAKKYIEDMRNGSPVFFERNSGETHEKGVKYDDDKCSYHLLPPFALEGTAWVFKCGAEKYAAWNHSNGMAWSKMLRAAQSHIDEIRKGRPNDPEFGTHHVFHAICSLMMLAEAIMMYPENNDLYPDAYIKRKNKIDQFMAEQKEAALNYIHTKRAEKK